MISPFLNSIFNQATAEHVFPGGAIWLGCLPATRPTSSMGNSGASVGNDGCIAHAAFGTTAYEDSISRPVTTDTLYDIASLTKLFTTTAFLIAARENGVSLETSLAEFQPIFAASHLEAITLRHLLNHTNGLAIHIQSLIDFPPSEWPRRIAEGGLLTPPGEKVRYTCTAYFLLGQVIEQVTQTPLETWMDERIIHPLDLKHTGFHPLRRFDASHIAPTEKDEATGEVLCGIVHDEAARAVEGAGSVSGNAGLFSTAADLSRFACLWLQNGLWEGQQIIKPGDVHRALNEAVPAENYRQGLGWHLDVSSWMSLKAPRGSAGHAGFTGPTLFISPLTGHTCIVLDNRVYPTRHGPLRMGFHRRIAEWLFSSTSQNSNQQEKTE